MSDADDSPLRIKPIYVRQKFQVKRKPRTIYLNAHVHGVECDVYINGIFAHRLNEPGKETTSVNTGWSSALPEKVLDAIVPGENVIAYHCRKIGNSPRISIELVQHFPSP